MSEEPLYQVSYEQGIPAPGGAEGARGGGRDHHCLDRPPSSFLSSLELSDTKVYEP